MVGLTVHAVDHVPGISCGCGVVENFDFRFGDSAFADVCLLYKVLVALDTSGLAPAHVFEGCAFHDYVIVKALAQDGRNFRRRAIQPCVIDLLYQKANFFAPVIVRRSGGHGITAGTKRV